MNVVSHQHQKNLFSAIYECKYKAKTISRAREHIYRYIGKKNLNAIFVTFLRSPVARYPDTSNLNIRESNMIVKNVIVLPMTNKDKCIDGINNI